MAEREVTVQAHAKLNLFLRVLRGRPDGYHDIESLVLPVSLADTVTVRAEGELSFGMRSLSGPLVELPDGADNLALLAAEAWIEAHRTAGHGAEVILEKRIPVAAGLGGGSSDAAAVLRAMNELWGRPLTSDRLRELAAGLGSDVPALLHGGPVLIRGRGEVVQPAEVAPLWWVLLPLGFPVRSAAAYGWWDEDGEATGPDPGPVIAAAGEGDLDRLAPLLFNDLQAPVARRHPEVEEARRRLLDGGALAALMSGSGPTVVGLARSEEHAGEVAARVPSAMAVRSLG